MECQFPPTSPYLYLTGPGPETRDPSWEAPRCTELEVLISGLSSRQQPLSGGRRMLSQTGQL